VAGAEEASRLTKECTMRRQAQEGPNHHAHTSIYPLPSGLGSPTRYIELIPLLTPFRTFRLARFSCSELTRSSGASTSTTLKQK
jgi:hypothetical protein